MLQRQYDLRCLLERGREGGREAEAIVSRACSTRDRCTARNAKGILGRHMDRHRFVARGLASGAIEGFPYGSRTRSTVIVGATTK